MPVGLISKDGKRVYRFPAKKERGAAAGKVQANLEEYTTPAGGKGAASRKPIVVRDVARGHQGLTQPQPETLGVESGSGCRLRAETTSSLTVVPTRGSIVFETLFHRMEYNARRRREGSNLRDYEAHRLTERPDTDAVEVFSKVPAAFVSDYLKQIGVVNHTLRGVRPLKGFDSDRHLAGPAITMYLAPVNETVSYQDAPYLHTEIVEQAVAGDVIVIAGQGAPYGFWGDHTTHQSINQGLAGVVIDGFTRDSRAIRQTSLPVFSTGVTFESYVRRYDPVGYNVTVACAGAMVSPGDLIVGDDDGVVVVPKSIVSRVAEGMQVISQAEDELRNAVETGVPWSEIYPMIHKRKYLSETNAS